ncbi:MAG: hypothetical protein AB7K24_06770 [Gemmataceae bacterium]
MMQNFISVALLLGGLWLIPSASAQAGSPGEDSEVRQLTAQIEKLKEQLQKAQEALEKAQKKGVSSGDRDMNLSRRLEMSQKIAGLMLQLLDGRGVKIEWNHDGKGQIGRGGTSLNVEIHSNGWLTITAIHKK